MNRILKKASVIFLTATLLLFKTPCNYNAFAETVDNTNISEELLNNLPKGLLEQITNENEKIVSVTTEYYNFNDGTTTTMNNARSVMPTYDFKMTIVVTEATLFGYEDYDKFRITACGEWIDNPAYEFTDCIGLAWSDNFTLLYDNAWVEYNDGTTSYSVCTLNDVVPEAGVAYDVNLKLGQRERYVYLTATVYADDATGTANAVATYGHVVVRASSVDVSFSGGSSGPEVGMTVGILAGIEKASPAYASFRY